MSQQGFYAYQAVMMGSPILLKLPQPDEPLARNVFRLIKQQENLLTVNRPLPGAVADPGALSQVMEVNLAAGQHPVQVSQPVFNLIARAHDVSVLPGSAFNFAIGPLVKRWKIGFQGHSVPPQAELDALLQLTDARKVQLDADARTVFLPQPGMEIDLGAIAKGYIADVVRDYLRQQGVADALINLGGNVQTLGNSAGQPWGIGLQRPFGAKDSPIGVVSVSGKSVVTSGVYERYFESNGRRYHHILDPQSGYPLDNELLSVTVIATDSIDGDIWTTLLFGLGVENGLSCLQAQPEIEAIFVTRDRQVTCSSQRQFSFTLLDAEYGSVTL